jgi:hypothetical protein
MSTVVTKCWGLYIVQKKNYHQETKNILNMNCILNAQCHTVLTVLIDGIKRKNRLYSVTFFFILSFFYHNLSIKNEKSGAQHFFQIQTTNLIFLRFFGFTILHKLHIHESLYVPTTGWSASCSTCSAISSRSSSSSGSGAPECTSSSGVSVARGRRGRGD